MLLNNGEVSDEDLLYIFIIFFKFLRADVVKKNMGRWGVVVQCTLRKDWNGLANSIAVVCDFAIAFLLTSLFFLNHIAGPGTIIERE